MRIAPKGKQQRITLPLQAHLIDLVSGDAIKIAWMANLFRKKLEEQGIRISEQDFDVLRDEVRKRFHNEDGLSWDSPWHLDIPHEGDVKLNFGPQDADGFMSLVVQGTVKACTPLMLEGVLRDLDGEAEVRTRTTDEFRRHLRLRWGRPLKLFAAQVALAGKFGEDTNAWLRDNRPEGKFSVIEAVTRLQARATQVACEIELLLQNGFADGALSRWRTLHEVSIVAQFIEQEGEETAQRYLDHLEVDSRDMARFMQKAAMKSGDSELTQREVKELEERVASLRIQHGSEFDGYYGWASKAIESRLKRLGTYDPKKKINPTFFDIEEAVDMDRLRPYYKLASGTVHAGPKGAFFKLGLLPQYSNAILAGPSNAGLSEAGRLSAWSLSMACMALMMVEPMLDGVMWGSVITELGALAGDAFLSAERRLHEDEGIIDEKRTRLVGKCGPRLQVHEKPSARLRRRMGL